jgi:hypothetical protein
MLNQFRVNFNLFSQEISNRFDVDFIGFQNRFSVKNYYSFNDLFSIKKENQVNITYLDDNFYYSEI